MITIFFGDYKFCLLHSPVVNLLLSQLPDQQNNQPLNRVSIPPDNRLRCQHFIVERFTFTGNIQTMVVPLNVKWIDVDIAGAAGGLDASSGGRPGFGARVQAIIGVVGGSVLNIFVGGRGEGSLTCNGGGSTYQGGWNGGGGCNSCGTGGGGASDIRVGGTDLNNRIIVAGGGGGWNTACFPTGGSAGQIGDFGSGCAAGGTGGTATAGGIGGTGSVGGPDTGSLGTGGYTTVNSGGGGGGGYYGGKDNVSLFFYKLRLSSLIFS
jgi:hypothetical protein